MQCRPDWPKAHWRKASALKLSGKVVEAVDVLEQALDTVKPNGWYFHGACERDKRTSIPFSSPISLHNS